MKVQCHAQRYFREDHFFRGVAITDNTTWPPDVTNTNYNNDEFYLVLLWIPIFYFAKKA